MRASTGFFEFALRAGLIFTHTCNSLLFSWRWLALVHTHTRSSAFLVLAQFDQEDFANVARCGFRFYSLLHDDKDFWIPTSFFDNNTHTNTNMSDTEPKPADEVMAAGDDETNEEVHSSSPSTNTHTHTEKDKY